MAIVTSILSRVKRLFYTASHPAQLAKPHAVIAPTTILLGGTQLDFRIGAEPRPYVRIGEVGLIKAVFTFESLEGSVTIGNNVHLGGVQFISRTSIEVGNDVTMAWDIVIYDHDSHSVDWEHRKHDNWQCYEDFHAHNGNNIANKNWTNVKTAPIVIKDKAWIGFGVTILKGVTIGEGAVIGAKSVVTSNIPAWTVAAGNPARVVKQLRTPENL